jgi:hypothetical protein
MSAVTGLHRLSILAIASLVAAGCGATPNSPAPSTIALASPTPAPATIGPPAPSDPPPQLPTPAPGCIALDEADLEDLEVDLSSAYPNGDGGLGGFSIGQVYAALDVTRVEELSGRKRSAVPPPPGVSNERGLMLGGRQFVTFPSTWFDGHDNPQAMIEARVTLMLDGESPLELPTRFVPGNENFDQVEVTVPDVGGRGRVELAFVWADPCFRYEAAGTIPVDVVPLARTAGCELDEERYWDELHKLLDGSIAVAGTTPNVGSAFNESKFAPYVNPGIDAFIGYMFDADAPEPNVPSGSTIRIERLKERVHLAEKLKVVIWTRRSIAEAVTDYPPKGAVVVFEGRLERQPDGSYELPVPDDPGRYVVALSVEFDSRCTTGTLWSVVNIATV